MAKNMSSITTFLSDIILTPANDIIVKSGGMRQVSSAHMYASPKKVKREAESLVNEWLRSYSNEYGRADFMPVPRLSVEWWEAEGYRHGRYILSAVTVQGPVTLAQWSVTITLSIAGSVMDDLINKLYRSGDEGFAESLD